MFVYYSICFYLNVLWALLYLAGLQINDIEPFCQEEIALYKECAERRVRPFTTY